MSVLCKLRERDETLLLLGNCYYVTIRLTSPPKESILRNKIANAGRVRYFCPDKMYQKLSVFQSTNNNNQNFLFSTNPERKKS